MIASTGFGVNGRPPAALVIGAGIAGIQAALDIADAGFRVYLVEQSPSIGGRMAQLDKTFPTLDCSACILTPKMADVPRNPNITLLTWSEVENVQGQAGDFTITIRKRARLIDESLCTGCGVCQEKCPKKVLDTAFQAGRGIRKAIYTPFPQAVPNYPVIDRGNCIFFQRGTCRACEKLCPRGAVRFDQQDEIHEVKVDTIVVASGFDVFDARRKPELGYGRYPQVITTLEFERLVAASGPTAGKIIVNDREPSQIVFIHCVGSRDGTVGAPYCSRVCCMAVAKQAHLAHERLHGAEITVFYMDVRAFGKGFEEFYDRVREEGITYRRGNPSEIIRRGDKVVVRAEDTLLGEQVEAEADMVVLAVGIGPKAGAERLAAMLGLAQDEYGFFQEAHPKLGTVETSVPGVFVAGCCQGPKDIPDTVAQAKAAASAVKILLATVRPQAERETAYVAG